MAGWWKRNAMEVALDTASIWKVRDGREFVIEYYSSFNPPPNLPTLALLLCNGILRNQQLFRCRVLHASYCCVFFATFVDVENA